MYRLNIIRDGYVVETRQIEAGKTLKLSAQPNTSYQLLDETGMVLHESPQAYILGSDWVLMDNAEPILVLENYTQYFPISDTNVLMANNMTLMTTVPTNGVPLEPVLASEVSSGISSTGVPLGAKIAAGLLAAGSVAALAGGSGGSSSDDKPVVDPNNPDNHLPSLKLGKSEVSVKENIQGATITTVQATDEDGDKISYSVSDSRFEIDDKGNLKLKAGQFLDYETDKPINLKITAKDGKGLQDTETVKINVQDVNEQPDLTVGKNEVSIKENIQGATITTVSFKDPDGDKPQYEVSDNRFEVVSGNLKLKAGQSLDYEEKKTVTVKITAKDGKGLQDTETVKINVQDDASDNPVIPPALNNNAIKLSLEKDTGASNSDKITNNGTIQVAGVDGQKWVYSNDGGKTWKAASGNQISITGDGEKNVQVSLSEDGKNPIANPQSIKFTLDTSIKEPSIDYDYNNGTLKITIIAEPNSTLQTKFDGVDEKIVVDATGKYEIKLDIPQDDSEVLLPIQMTAVDQAGNKSKTVEKTVIIPALDVDPVTPPANQAPVWSQTSETVTVKENWTGNIATQATASDPDKDTLTYSVSGDSRFSIDSKTGSLKLNSALDFENEKDKSISLKVTASDGKGGKAEKTVHTNLTNDPNDDPVTPPANQPPVWSQTSETVSIKENAKGVTVSTDKASDPDGDALTYSIDEASQKLFTIDSKTGTLKVKDVLDYETAKQHQVKVTASDGKLSAVKTVTVNVENVNESPVWRPTSETITVKENWTGDIATQATASDPDKDTLTYSVSGDSRFSIDSKTGSLKLNPALDFENEKDKSISLKVTASDGKGGKAEKTVHINLTNDTDDDPVTPPANQAPAWSKTFETFEFKENEFVEINNILNATDPDGDPINYDIDQESKNNGFLLTSNGYLRGPSGDYETVPEHRVELTATDKYGLSATKTIIVKVIDIPENIYWKNDITEATVQENMKGPSAPINKADGASPLFRNEIIMEEGAYINDDYASKCTYELANEQDRFEISKDGRRLTLKPGVFLDYEKESTVDVKVIAIDEKGNRLPEHTVRINVKDDTSVGDLNAHLKVSLVNDTGRGTQDFISQDLTAKVEGLNNKGEWYYCWQYFPMQKDILSDPSGAEDLVRLYDWVRGKDDGSIKAPDGAKDGEYRLYVAQLSPTGISSFEELQKLKLQDYEHPELSPYSFSRNGITDHRIILDTAKPKPANNNIGLSKSNNTLEYPDILHVSVNEPLKYLDEGHFVYEKVVGKMGVEITADFIDEAGNVVFTTKPTITGRPQEEGRGYDGVEGDFKPSNDIDRYFPIAGGVGIDPKNGYRYQFNFGDNENIAPGKYKVVIHLTDVAGNEWTSDSLASISVTVPERQNNASTSLLLKDDEAVDDHAVYLLQAENNLRMADILDDGDNIAVSQKSSDQVLMVNGYQYDTHSDIAHVNMLQDTAYLL